MILPIYLYGSQVLRTAAQEDDLSDRAWLEHFIADMVDTIYVDVTTPMLSLEGQAQDEYFAGDSLHLSPKGYAVWTSVLRPLLNSSRLLSLGATVWILLPESRCSASHLRAPR